MAAEKQLCRWDRALCYCWKKKSTYIVHCLILHSQNHTALTVSEVTVRAQFQRWCVLASVFLSLLCGKHVPMFKCFFWWTSVIFHVVSILPSSIQQWPYFSLAVHMLTCMIFGSDFILLFTAIFLTSHLFVLSLFQLCSTFLSM